MNMPSSQQKTVINKSFKLRIKNKFESLVEETEEVVTLLKTCVSEFEDRKNELLKITNASFQPEYEKLSADFEKFLENLCLVRASIESSNCADDNEEVGSLDDIDDDSQRVSIPSLYESALEEKDDGSTSQSSTRECMDTLDADNASVSQKLSLTSQYSKPSPKEFSSTPLSSAKVVENGVSLSHKAVIPSELLPDLSTEISISHPAKDAESVDLKASPIPSQHSQKKISCNEYHLDKESERISLKSHEWSYPSKAWESTSEESSSVKYQSDKDVGNVTSTSLKETLQSQTSKSSSGTHVSKEAKNHDFNSLGGAIGHTSGASSHDKEFLGWTPEMFLPKSQKCHGNSNQKINQPPLAVQSILNSIKNKSNDDCDTSKFRYTNDVQESNRKKSLNQSLTSLHKSHSELHARSNVQDSSKTESLQYHEYEIQNRRQSQTLCKTLSVQEITDSSIALPSFSIPTVISATFSHINNPHDFWIQVKSGQVFCYPLSQFSHTKPLTNFNIGEYCLAPFKSNPYYYRAQIIRASDEDVEVFFIDHGSNETYSLEDLRPLPNEAYSISMQCIHCTMSNILPTDGVWSKNAIAKLKSFQTNVIETHLKSFECGKYDVQLVATLSGDFSLSFSCDIADYLCMDNFAIYNEELPQTASIPSEESNKVSCDSGVSFTLNQQSASSSQTLGLSSNRLNDLAHHQSSDQLHKMTENTLSFPLKNDEHTLRSAPSTGFENYYSRELTVEESKLYQTTPKCWNLSQTSDLMSFESVEEVGDNLNAGFLFKKCSKTSDCDCALHLIIPPASFSFVEENMMLIMLSHFDSPYEFYANPAVENSFLLDDLQESMTNLYATRPNVARVSIEDLKKGMYVAAHYKKDEMWYRAKILHLNLEPESSYDAHVQYVDYGNTAFVKCCDLRQLTPQFTSHPSFSIKCSLAGISPKTNLTPGSQEQELWVENAVKHFDSVVDFQRCLTAQILQSLDYPRHENDAIEVFLWDTEGAEDILINEVLAESDLFHFDKTLQKYQNIQEESAMMATWDPMLDEFSSIENSYGTHMDDPEVALSGYKPQDETYICKYYSLRGYCPIGPSCKKEHVSLPEYGVTRDQEEIYSLDHLPPLPEESADVLVHVTSVKNPGMFYCLLPFGNKSVDDVDSYVNRGTDILWMKDEVNLLFHELNEHYGQAPFTENTGVAISLGTIVVAWHKKHDAWHRGRIVDVSDITGPARVFFVDIGDDDWISRKEIRTIESRFLHTPFQAVECHLANVEPLGYENNRRWNQNAIFFFIQLVSSQILLAHVTFRCGKVLHVTLRKAKENDHSDIGENLVEKGFAQSRTLAREKKEVMYMPG